MPTDLCKEALVEEFANTSAKDWKRTSKKTIDGHIYRTFASPKVAYPVLVIIEVEMDGDAEADEYMILPAGDKLVYMVDQYDGECCVMLTPQGYHDLNDGAMYDQHCGHILSAIYSIPDWIIEDEVSENSFISSRSVEEVVETLDALGHIRKTN